MTARPIRRPVRSVAAAVACASSFALAVAPSDARSGARAQPEPRRHAPAPAQTQAQTLAQTQVQPAGFALTGAFGGKVVDLASRGGRTVALVGQRLEVLDAAGGGAGAAAGTDGALGLLAVSPPLPGTPAAVALSDDGSTAYVAAGDAGVLVVDVTAGGTAGAPAQAPIVARLASPPSDGGGRWLGGITGVAVAGATLYALEARRLDLYDVAVPGRPAGLSSLALDDEFHFLAAADWGAALLGIPAPGDTNVRLVDAADRHRPLLAGGASVDVVAANDGGIAVQDRRVFVYSMSGSAWVDAASPFTPQVHDVPLDLIDLDFAPDRSDPAVAIGRSLSGDSNALIWLDLTNASAPRRLVQADLDVETKRVALVDPAARAAVADDPAGIALLRPGPDGTPARAAHAERVGPVQSAAPLDDAHLVALTADRLAVVRRADGVVVAEDRLDRSAGGAVWHDVVTDQGWAYVSGFSSVYELTPFDLREPTVPVRGDPILIGGRGIRSLTSVSGWIAVLSTAQAYLLSTTAEGIGRDWREVPLAAAETGAPSIALAPRSLVVSDARGVRSIDLADRSLERTLLPPPGADQPPWSVVAAGDAWFVTRRFADGLSVHRMAGRAADAPRLVPATRDFELAFVDGDRAVALGRGVVGAEPGLPPAPEIAAIDLAGATVVARTAVGYGMRLANLGRHDGRAQAGTISLTGALLTWLEVEAPAATATPLPSATHPVPTDAPPPAGPTIHLPYAAVFRAAAKPPVTLRPTVRLGGFADAVAVERDIAWLRERGRLTGVDIGQVGLPPLGSVDVCAPDACTLEPFAASGGRLAVNDGDGGVRIVDVADPRRPRLGGRIPDDSGLLPGFLVVAPWPGSPLFLLARRVEDPAAIWNGEATELQIVDATDADAPRTVRTLRRPEPLGPIVAANDLVYALSFRHGDPSTGELQVWSLTADGDLTVVGRADSDQEWVADALAQGRASVVASPSRLFVATGDDQFAAFDLSDPRLPLAIEPPALRHALSAAGSPILPFDVSAVQAFGPTLVVTLPGVQGFIAVPATGADAPAAIVEVPVLNDRPIDGRARAGAMAVASDRLVLAGGAFGGLTVTDGPLVQATSPASRPSTRVGVGAVRGLARAASGDSVLLTSGARADILHRIDLAAPEDVAVSDPATLAAEPRVRPSWFWHPDVDVAVDGEAVWAAGTDFVLTGFTAAAAGGPRAVPGSGRPEGLPPGDRRIGLDLMTGAGFAVTAHAPKGVEVWDVAERSGPPARVSHFSTGGAPEDVEVVDRRAYVADGPGGVVALDLGNPASPREVQRVRLPGAATRLAFDAGRSVLWVALEQRSDSRWPLNGIAGGRDGSAVAAVEVGADGALRVRGVVGLPAARIRSIALRADLVLISGALHDDPWTSPSTIASDQQTTTIIALDPDPASPSIRGTWHDRPNSRASGALAVLADGRVALAAGEDGVRVFEVEVGGW